MCGSPVNGLWTCDLTDMTGDYCDTAGGAMTIVTDYTGTGSPDYVAFGSCSANKFCCTLVDDSPFITAVAAMGSAYADQLHFDAGYPGSPTWDLKPADTSVALKGFIYGRGGNDTIEGSHYADTNPGNVYMDNLYGENDHDIIDGNQDGDWISCGEGNDTAKGDDGADSILGGPGNESMTGAADADTVCDDAYAGSVCATQGQTYFNGGAGNDTIWYGWNVNCDTAWMDTSSTGAAGDDVCGDSANWTGMNELPQDCAASVTSAPAACTDPN